MLIALGGSMQALDACTCSSVRSSAGFGAKLTSIVFIFFMIGREMVYYVNLRQAYLMNPAYATKLPSRTVLYVAVPKPYLNEAKIRAMLGPQVKHVWFPTDTKELQDLVDERQKAAMTLEGAETNLIQTANGERLKATEKGASNDVEQGQTGADRWVTAKMRPTHRVPMIVGKKVDSVNWSREEITRLSPLVEEGQAKHRAGDAKKTGAVFVEFETMGAAQAAFQSVTHHQPLKMSPRWTGMAPAEVIWKNLAISGWSRFLRTWITTAIVIVTIVYWSIPVAFVGTISNINYWIGPGGKTPWLNFLNKVPTVVFGVITGLLPTVLLAVLMSLLPPFLRWMAKLGGSPTLGDVEYKVSNYYFGFQVVQVFLVTTFSSAASGSVFAIINNPSSAPTLLAKNLPQANSFYLSYIILQGLGVVSGMIAGIAGLFVTPLLARFLGKTPRKLFMTWNGLSTLSYGTVYPIYTNLLVIGKSLKSVDEAN
jgi:calcium permeable stress-gated cation channel